MAILVSAADSTLILFEDEHLLVVNKPAGWNTHAPAPFAGEGVYDWLKHREPRWANLAIIQRLDKETSGVMVFSKSTLANRSLTRQFTERGVRKKYLLLTDRPPPSREFTVISTLVRVGERYLSRPLRAGGDRAETRFRVLREERGIHHIEAEPVTGRTHQIRVHAVERGIPILGDILYGGTPGQRVCLHACELSFLHPVTQDQLTFTSPADFEADPRQQLRCAVIPPEATNAFRLIHGAADGHPGWYVDQLGDYLLSQSEAPLAPSQHALLREWQRGSFTDCSPGVPASAERGRLKAGLQTELAAVGDSGAQTDLGIGGVYHKTLIRQVRKRSIAQTSPQKVFGEDAPGEFIVRENGLSFWLSFREGYSPGLFLDQRDNRRRFLVNHVAANFPLFPNRAAGAEVLNTFAYTCGFSVCAAQAGARVTSLDLSRKYLEWGQSNFALNQLDPAGHDFVYGDTFDWLRRWHRKQRSFDAIILDPPTFSQSKEHGMFRAEKDYGRLVKSALGVLKPNGVLLACTNAAAIQPENFVVRVSEAIASTGRRIVQQHYVPQPPDFPITREEPGHLKTLWLRIE